MNKLFLLAIIGIVASKNIILIGDTRYVEMAIKLMGFDYSTKITEGGSFSNIRSKTPKMYNGDSFLVTAEVSASVYTFVKGKPVFESIHYQLSFAEQGTEVWLWLGINNLATDRTFNFYASLANQYKNLNFIVFPCTGVDESKIKNIKNANVKAFNAYMKIRVQGAKI